MRIFSAVLLLVLMISGAAAGAPVSDDEAKIRAVIASWYSELKKGFARREWQLYAPMAIDGGPGETEINPGSRARSPTISNELAARALEFAYDIDVLTIDARFAKVIVWERGYFYAWANEQAYENAAHAVFVMERQPDGRWLILAHEANSVGIPESKRTMPLPDMKARWLERGGAAAPKSSAD